MPTSVPMRDEGLHSATPAAGLAGAERTLAPVLPGAPGDPRCTLGVIGGGQLGRMFVHAAQAAGYGTVVLDPDPDSPAGAVAGRHLRAAYDDAAALATLADACAAVTTEFENVPAASLRALAQRVPVAPSAAAVAVCQHRAREKAFFQRAGVACAPHAVIETEADLAAVAPSLFPGVLKTSSLGYDGKGQLRVDSANALAAAWRQLGGVPCVLEQRLALRHEISVILARGRDGVCVHLPVQQNLHRDGILAVTQVPAPDVPVALAAQAVEGAKRLAAAMGYVGVLCVEFFVLADGRLVANEMAPRPHNSGHYSVDACDVSQFALQLRTLAGLPLTPPRLHSPALMLNVLGDLWFAAGTAATAAVTPPWAEVLALPGAQLHLYGKSEPRPGRKMGHLTVTAADAGTAQAVARQAAQRLGLPAF
ncbi:MAG: 5-(carboxyamino)imidazole ribonucleotide synthase [Rubrivivax sp.]